MISTEPTVKETIKGILRRRHELKRAAGRFWNVDRGNVARDARVASRLVLRDSEVIRMPQGFEYNPKNRFQEIFPEQNLYYPPIVLYDLCDIHLCGVRAAPLTRSRQVLTEHLGGSHGPMLASPPLNFFDYLRTSFRPIHKTHEWAYSLNGPYIFNYYHWFHDVLAYLWCLEQIPIEDQPTLILPSELASWQTRSLELVGFPRSRYVSYGGEHEFALKLSFPTWLRSETSNASPLRREIYEWMRTRVLNTATHSGCEYKKRLFISRKDSPRKLRISNEDAVFDLLSRYGFVQVILGEMELDHQVRAFENAEVIVATHGAGLTNLVFSNKPILIELFGHGKREPFFFWLGEVIGARYMALCSNDEGSSIDLGRLQQLLELMLRGEDGWKEVEGNN